MRGAVGLVNLPRHRPNVLGHQRGAQTLDTTVRGEDGTLGDATKTGWWWKATHLKNLSQNDKLPQIGMKIEKW